MATREADSSTFSPHYERKEFHQPRCRRRRYDAPARAYFQRRRRGFITISASFLPYDMPLTTYEPTTNSYYNGFMPPVECFPLIFALFPCRQHGRQHTPEFPLPPGRQPPALCLMAATTSAEKPTISTSGPAPDARRTQCRRPAIPQIFLVAISRPALEARARRPTASLDGPRLTFLLFLLLCTAIIDAPSSPLLT